LTALVVLDPDTLAQYAAQRGLDASNTDALVSSAEIESEVSKAIARANTELARVEQIKKHVVLKQFWLPDSDELTPTLKLKRRIIIDKYSAEIESMYASVEAAR
jgi:long-subunit acyl-CoA synthetase (AMP-forming)